MITKSVESSLILQLVLNAWNIGLGCRHFLISNRKRENKTKCVLFKIDYRRSLGSIAGLEVEVVLFPSKSNIGGLNDRSNTSLSPTSYAGKSASYLQKVGRLPWALRFPLPVKLTATIRQYILKPKQSPTNNLFKIKRETAPLKSMLYLHISRAILRIY